MGSSKSKKTILRGIPFLIFIAYLTPIYVHAQELFTFQKLDLALPEADQEFRDYSVYALDILAVRDFVDRNDATGSAESLVFSIPGHGEFQFNLIPYEIRGAGYKLTVANQDGIADLPRSHNKTYRGYTDHFLRDVRLTMDTAFISGFIATEDDLIYIESAWKYSITPLPETAVIVYAASDIIEKEEAICLEGKRQTGPQDPHDHKGKGHRNGGRSSACIELEVNLANDFQMYQEYSSSVTMVENQNLSVLNNVETNYDNEFDDDIQFVVNQIFVSTCSTCDPWPTTDDIGTVLTSFRNWAPNGFSEPHDVATLWSPRNFTDPDVGAGVIGLAYVGVICNSFRYNVCEDFTNNANSLRVLQAHEMGHNFNAEHDASGSPYIMAPSVNNTNDWSVTSESVINSFISSLNCLGPCTAGSAPVASFEANVTEGCVPLQVSFSDQSTDIPTSWLWTFEGGSPATSTAQNPVVTYETPGVYSVTLEVSNNFGSDISTLSDYISVGAYPVADFAYEVNNLIVAFTNFSDNYEQVFWNFGDGFTSTEVNPVHIYDQDGLYDVELTVSNGCGDDVYQLTLEIITAPVAGFSASQTFGCAPHTVQFFNQSSSNADEFFWTFEGGTPSSSTNPNPVVEFTEPGLFSVTLLVTNDVGADQLTLQDYIEVLPLPEASFTYTLEGYVASFNAVLGSNLNFTWEFGDGGSASGLNVNHVYSGPGSYDVMLITSNGCGMDTIIQTIELQGAPAPAFSSSAQNGCTPLQVQFTDASSGEVDTYNWVFQGGSPATSTLANPLVTYNQPGTFDVQLTVSNAFGNETVIITDYVVVSAEPTSNFQYLVNGTSVDFSNTSTGGDSFLWEFGDGFLSNQVSPVHTYAEDGIYEVTLTVSNPCGNASITRFVEIATPPTAGLGISQSSGCAPFTVVFDNQSSPNANSFLWTFEGGSPASSTAENPVVEYTEPGTYSVTLEVASNGGTDLIELEDVILVLPHPEAAFMIAGIDGRQVSFQNLSDNGDTYVWFFGDGTSTSATDPVHEYPEFGSYVAELVVSNECGADTFSMQLSLTTSPVVQFGASQTNGCAPFEVQFEDQSLNNPTSWNWLFPGGLPASSNERNPSVLYTTPGSYRVELIASNEAGTNELVLDDLITVGDKPVASFDYTVTGNTVEFRNTSQNSTDVLWQFGNGTSSNLDDVEIEYLFDGEYEVVMVVSNPCGSDTISQEIVIGLTDVTDFHESPFLIYPNPTSGILRIQGAFQGHLDVQVVNGIGQVVYRARGIQIVENQPVDLDLSGLTEGLYQVVFRIPTGSKCFPLVIQR